MLIAIIVNVLLMIIFMLLGSLLLMYLYRNVQNPGNGIGVWIFIIFFAAIALSWLIYSKIVKNLVEKHHLEDKISTSMFSKRGRKKPQQDENNMAVKS